MNPNKVYVRCASCDRVTSVPVHHCHVVYYPPVNGEDTARLYYRCSSCHVVEWLTLLTIEGRIHCERLGVTRMDWSDDAPADDCTPEERMAILEHAIDIWLRPEVRARALEIELERILPKADL